GAAALRPHALQPLRAQRPEAAGDLARALVELRRRPAARDEPRDRAARVRPRRHPLRPREQLRAAVRLGRAELRAAARAGPAALPRRAPHLDESGLGHVAWPVRRARLAEVPAREPRPEPRPDGARVRRHLLLAPVRPGDAARGDDGRPRHRRAAGEGTLRRYLLVRARADARGGRDPARARHAAPHPPAVVLAAQPLDRAGAPRHARGARRRLHRLLAARAGDADRPLPAGHPRRLARDTPRLAPARLPHGRDAREDPRPERDRRPPRPVARADGARVDAPRLARHLDADRREQRRAAGAEPAGARPRRLRRRRAGGDRPPRHRERDQPLGRLEPGVTPDPGGKSPHRVRVEDCKRRKEPMALDVTDATFEQEVVASDRKVLVDFWAEWCGPCHAVAPVLDRIAEERDLKLVKVNIDQELGLAQRFGVASIPMMILFENGEPQATAVGAMPKSMLERALGLADEEAAA